MTTSIERRLGRLEGPNTDDPMAEMSEDELRFLIEILDGNFDAETNEGIAAAAYAELLRQPDQARAIRELCAMVKQQVTASGKDIK